MTQLLHAVSFLHAQGIAHRDLKPENFLWESNDPNAQLKMIDFGLSNKFADISGQEVAMNTIVGSPYYVAPEVLSGIYGKECDVWSAGVILYILLSGSFPFSGSSNTEIFRAVREGNYNTSKGVWTQISPDVKDLISKMLQIDRKKRITADAALKHPWFSNDRDQEIYLDAAIINALGHYRAQSKMQKEATSIMVKYLDISELKELRTIFQTLDHTKSGTITAEELQMAMANAGIQPAAEEIQSIIDNIDYLGNGEINYTAFLAATFRIKHTITEQELWGVFRRFDTDDSGYITSDNLEQVITSAGHP